MAIDAIGYRAGELYLSSALKISSLYLIGETDYSILYLYHSLAVIALILSICVFNSFFLDTCGGYSVCFRVFESPSPSEE